MNLESKQYNEGEVVEVLKGMQSSFTCQAEGSKPASDITWTLAGDFVTPTFPLMTIPNSDDDRLFDTTSTFVYNGSSEHHTGTIRCSATNNVLPAVINTYVSLDIQCKSSKTCFIILCKKVQ